MLALELPLMVIREIQAIVDLQLIIDYTSTELLQAAVMPEPYRRIVDSELHVVQGIFAA